MLQNSISAITSFLHFSVCHRAKVICTIIRRAQNMHGLPLKWVGSNWVCFIGPTWSRGCGSSLREQKKNVSSLSVPQIRGNSTLVESMLNADGWKMSTLFRLEVRQSHCSVLQDEYVPEICCTTSCLWELYWSALKPLLREVISYWMLLLQLRKREIYSNVSGCFYKFFLNDLQLNIEYFW